MFPRNANKRAVVVAAACLCLLALASCGRGQLEATHSGRGKEDPAMPKVFSPPLAKLSEAKDERGRYRALCLKARVNLGPRPGAIRIGAWCFAPGSGGMVGFSMERRSLHGLHSAPRLLAFQMHPSVVGAGATADHGVCSGGGSVVSCSAHLDGPARVIVSASVDPATQCDFGVFVGAVRHAACVDGECDGGPRFYLLFRGRPRGCQ